MADINIDLETSNPVELLGQGIKAFHLRDFNAAVTALSKASEIAVKQYGDDKHDSLGHTYLFYGKALLELSREEAEPLGDAVPRVLNESDDDDDDSGSTDESELKKNEGDEGNIKNDSAEKDEEKTENKKNELPDKLEEGKTEKNEDSKDIGKEIDKVPNGNVEEQKSENKSQKEKEVTESNSNEPESSSNNENGEKEEENNEDPSDLQVAWEVLELAKIIFQRRGDVGRKDLAETLITLGEVSLESENFESAINDIKEGLEIQKTVYENDSRQLAQTYYKLGMALSTNNQIDEAIDNFNLSLNILNNKIEKLKSSDDTTSVEAEVEEIKSLIPEIEEKIADMKSFKEEAAKKISASIEKQSNKFEAGSSDVKPNDISHLVKRKRKLEDITEELEGKPAKRSSPDESKTTSKTESEAEPKTE